jgi:hypothetical protein
MFLFSWIGHLIVTALLAMLLTIAAGYWLWHHFTHHSVSPSSIAADINHARRAPSDLEHQLHQAVTGLSATADLNLGWSAASDVRQHQRFLRPSAMPSAMIADQPVLRHRLSAVASITDVHRFGQLFLVLNRCNRRQITLVERAGNGQLWQLTGSASGVTKIIDLGR